MSRKAVEVEAPADEVTAALRRAWLLLHPTATDVTITRNADGSWCVDVPGGHVERVARNRETFQFVAVARSDRETPIAPPVVVAIPRAPEPEPVAVGFDPAAARARVLRSLDGVRETAERVRRQLRPIEGDDAAERHRLRESVPLTASTMDGRPLSAEPMLRVLARDALTAVTEARTFAAEVDAATRLSGEIRTLLREAGARVHTDRARPLDDLGDLGALGEVLGEKRSQWEYSMGECRVACDRLDHVLAELAPLGPRFHEVARRHAVVAAEVLVEAVVGLATLKLAQIRAEAEAVRNPHGALRIVAEALYFVDPALAVPAIVWPSDVLDAPSMG